MCGRAVCNLAPGEICKRCQYRDSVTGKTMQPLWVVPPGGGATYQLSYNIPPSKYLPVLYEGKVHEDFTIMHVNDENEKKDVKEMESMCSSADSTGSAMQRLIQPMRWGLVPSWFKGDVKEFKLTTSNARVEGLTEKSTFRSALTHGQRCVVLAEGFYEWKRTDGSKQPFYIHLPDNSLMMMAGIYDITGSKDAPLYSFSVITVESEGPMAAIHNRTPAILDTPEAVNIWLDGARINSTKAISECIRCVQRLTLIKVSTFVNSIVNDSPHCVEPLQEKKPATMLSNWLKRSSDPDKKEAVDEKKMKSLP